MGTRHALELLPLVERARRRTAQARRGRQTPRPEGARRSGAAACSRTIGSRALAIEFGTQWIHVRGFDELKEKNEKLFPTFDAELRKAIYEESILFFQDLFQSDRAGDADPRRRLHVPQRDAGEALRHPRRDRPAVATRRWRAEVRPRRRAGPGERAGEASGRVAHQPGAARQLGGRNAARREAAATAGERAATARRGRRRQTHDAATGREARIGAVLCRLPSCASTRSASRWRSYDPIGRRREKDLGGLPVDAHAKLKDGTEFDGIDGLRNYLLTKKKDVIVRLFCRKLLGYALGRSVTLSDTALLDEMVAELNKNDGRISAAVLAIVRSPQFQKIRARIFLNNEGIGDLVK